MPIPKLFGYDLALVNSHAQIRCEEIPRRYSLHHSYMCGRSPVNPVVTFLHNCIFSVLTGGHCGVNRFFGKRPDCNGMGCCCTRYIMFNSPSHWRPAVFYDGLFVVQYAFMLLPYIS